MINIIIYQEDNLLKKVSIKGHSNYAPKGEDIVCAGVSAIGVGTVNAIYEITKQKPEFHSEDGNLELEFPSGGDAQIIAKTMLIQLKSIEESYPKYVKIQFK